MARSTKQTRRRRIDIDTLESLEKAIAYAERCQRQAGREHRGTGYIVVLEKRVIHPDAGPSYGFGVASYTLGSDDFNWVDPDDDEAEPEPLTPEPTEDFASEMRTRIRGAWPPKRSGRMLTTTEYLELRGMLADVDDVLRNYIAGSEPRPMGLHAALQHTVTITRED